MSDEHEAAPVTREQAEEYARYWTAIAHSTNGQEQVDAHRSADYWAKFAAQMVSIESPDTQSPPTQEATSFTPVESTVGPPAITSAQAREYEFGWAAQANQLSGDEQSQAFAAATYWQEQANALAYIEAQQLGLVNSAYAQSSTGARPRAPRRTFKELMTKGVIGSLAVVSLLVVATLVTGILLVNQRVEARELAQGPEADKVAAAYLDAAIVRDTKALEALQRSDFELYHQSDDPEIIPIEHLAGNQLAAESIDLEVSYEVVQTDYLTNGGKRPDQDFASKAEVVVRVIYQFTAEHEPVEVWSLQTVKLQRDFYYDGRNTPADFIDPKGSQPSFRGPWGVQAVDGLIPYLDEPSELTGSNYQATIPEKRRYDCMSTRIILIDISEYALQHGGIPVTCLAGGADFTNFSNEDLDHLEATLTPLRDAPVSEVVGLDSPFSEQFSSQPPLPFVEAVITAGERRFIFVMALVDPALAEDESDAYSEYRLISIVGLDK